MDVVRTHRLVLRRLGEADGAFILELLNEPSFIRNIGDKGVRSVADARRYIAEGPVASYLRHGFGLYLVVLTESGAPIGICGLLKRDALADPDVGFALLPHYRARGYALEAAAAVMSHGRTELGLRRIVAVTRPDNRPSIRVLEKLGLRFDRMVRVAEDSPEVELFVPGAEGEAG